MNGFLLVTLCCLGMVAAQDNLISFLAMKRLFDQANQQPGTAQNTIASKGLSTSDTPGTTGSQMFGRTSRRSNMFRNPMNWYVMDQMVDIPDAMMWPLLMGGFN
ncbi:uncharacterized protein LOC133193796 isoform X1 [Saccostrea echinata]|uniref:uncharacterized protein LOC133193796 isoform X1 n=1 Tax=Saccostrea echinata TaxID=191078 RepID=UPI002A80DE09|nr:uncharacterized protein LOC133193796 isoform X1 [Saccostrea echinata]